MKWQTIGSAVLLPLLMASMGWAQCNRGGSSPSAGNVGSQFTQSLANPYSSGLTGGLLSSQVPLQQRAMLAQQQQMYRQAMAERQRRSTQLARRRSSSRSDSTALAANRPTSRQARLRQENAEKAFTLAVRAESRGKSEVAEKYYRRAIAIAGSNAELADRAETAIAALAPIGDTLTVLANR